MKRLMTSITIVLSILLLFSNCKKKDTETKTDPVVVPVNDTGSFNDSRDGKDYKWVKIGDQVWMSENLAYKPENGDYVVYDNNETYADVYGYFYTWDMALVVAPIGWHLPTKEEWETLFASLGGADVAGGKMKSTDTQYWNSPNEGADNSSGFTALGCGYYDSYGFQAQGNAAAWWSATDGYGENNSAAYFDEVYTLSTLASGGAISKTVHFPVRCIKD